MYIILSTHTAIYNNKQPSMDMRTTFYIGKDMTILFSRWITENSGRMSIIILHVCNRTRSHMHLHTHTHRPNRSCIHLMHAHTSQITLSHAHMAELFGAMLVTFILGILYEGLRALREHIAGRIQFTSSTARYARLGARLTDNEITPIVSAKDPESPLR